uniref:NADH-ubiquinone oxidoreductase chain 5 n=2 Tax=Chorotypus fenestratus TaxID=1564101 RepID=A0A0N7AYC4_9ORTH|nr:NADH dehydrogenase subunit 5 [Chorotypus fenestratus]
MCLLGFIIMFILSLLFIFVDIYLIMGDLSYFIELEFFNLNSSSVVMTFLFDWMSLTFLSFVLFISSLVSLYSIDYMASDKNMNRFMFLIFLFVFSMVFLIISPNLISILLGWDGLGLISYCLVIYYHNTSSYNSGSITLMTNRLGDVALLFSIAWMFNFGGWNYIYYCNFFNFTFDFNMIIIMLVVASMTSSAQVPFSAWLPAAMAAPTPVSSLVHSSTLVTAGVYLMIRFGPVLLLTGLNKFLLMIGCFTMLLSGLVANFEYDLKSIIALSTLSQLGFMMMTLSLGYFILSFFHLLTHALFSALLFLCAGSYIHSYGDFQDVRYMGSLVYYMPYTSICFSLSNLSLCGLPFLSGYYSKDLILELMNMNLLGLLTFFIFFFGTGLTAMYTFRLFFFIQFDYVKNLSLINVNDNCHYMNWGMFGLMIVSVFGGSFLMWLIFPLPSLIVLPMFLSCMTLLSIFLGVYIGYFLFSFTFVYKKFMFIYSVNLFFGSMCYMPFLSTSFISLFPLLSGLKILKIYDYGWLELVGPQGLYSLFIYCLFYIQSALDYKYSIYLLSLISLILLFMLFF